MLRKRRKSQKVVICLLLIFCFLYVGSYSVLSYFGDYVATQSGEVRNSKLFNMAVMDVREWCPKFIFGHLFRDVHGRITYRGNVLGFIYAPLVVLDQKYIHRKQHIISLPNEIDSVG